MIDKFVDARPNQKDQDLFDNANDIAFAYMQIRALWTILFRVVEKQKFWDNLILSQYCSRINFFDRI